MFTKLLVVDIGGQRLNLHLASLRFVWKIYFTDQQQTARVKHCCFIFYPIIFGHVLLQCEAGSWYCSLIIPLVWIRKQYFEAQTFFSYLPLGPILKLHICLPSIELNRHVSLGIRVKLLVHIGVTFHLTFDLNVKCHTGLPHFCGDLIFISGCFLSCFRDTRYNDFLFHLKQT
jgi:hypothetical protein